MATLFGAGTLSQRSRDRCGGYPCAPLLQREGPRELAFFCTSPGHSTVMRGTFKFGDNGRLVRANSPTG
jgi:hypothetical protein